jgi:hypothetical protein
VVGDALFRLHQAHGIQCQHIRFGADDTPKAVWFNVKRDCGGCVTYVILSGGCAGIIIVILGAGQFWPARGREPARVAIQLRSNMGHIRIGTLPASRQWKDVIGLIAEGVEAARVYEG